MDNTIMTDIAKTFTTQLVSQVRSEDLLNSMFGKNGVTRPNINKTVWIGNYRISIRIH